MAEITLPKFLTARLPHYNSDSLEFVKWRYVFEGGVDFRTQYLKQLSNKESAPDFYDRRDISPIPTDARDNILEVRNSVFQRLSDVVRRGGSESYQKAVAGEDGGVDMHGSSMNFFLGDKIIDELLVMQQCGIYVDMPPKAGHTLADNRGVRPYIYSYRREDILNYTLSLPGEKSEFKSILLRDVAAEYDTTTGLQLGTTERFRLMWVGEDGRVYLQFYNASGKPVNIHGEAWSKPVALDIERIPFVLLDIKQSLMKTVADDNITLLNLASLDAHYAIKSNFPFYIEARDPRAAGSHLKRVATDGTATAGGQGARDENVKVGNTQGRYYDKDVPAPRFISPPTEPIMASMELQKRMEQRIRRKLHLTLQGLGTQATSSDNEALNAGLSFIGLVLQNGEAKIADYWAAYESRNPSGRKVAKIAYPDRYSLKTDMDRIEETTKLSKLVYNIPSRAAKKAIAEIMADTLFNGKLSVEELQEIKKEIKSSEFTTSDPETVIKAKDAGLVGERTASISLGYNDDEYLLGRADHLERVKRLAEAQAGGQNPAARGVPDMDQNPQSGRDEKELSRNTDLRDSTKRRVRGRGRKRKNEQQI